MKVLILGGCGFIGRHFAHFLVSNDLAEVRVADKVPPQIAWFNDFHKEVFTQVEFVSCNLINAGSTAKAFETDDGSEFDAVINLAAETKYGQTDEIYKEGILNLSLNCAREAAKRSIKIYIEVSTGQVYNSDKKASNEDSKASPWTGIAKYKLMVEEELRSIEGLNYMIVRPAIVYGIADKIGLTPRLIIGAVYKQLQEKMKLLWSKDLKMNTVYVHDVCRGLWHLVEKGEVGEVYNLVDKSDTTQGTITDVVCRLFGIQHDYFGTLMSNFARVNMTEIVEESNEKHLAPWSDACKENGIENTPLSPYLDQELLYNKHLYLDGRKIEATGFQYEHPHVSMDSLRAVLKDYVEMGIFPKNLVP
ncbi:dTDP-D-glucose 4,6-dehydratase-like isoform X2 [Anneissia japonica]|uniref:dTDP-D-glucose 4,6-dehydratase-like isoform X1 n=1 Tax=Anneissia japonica TaxID=1529436 RepID=UPI00142570B8|nr:dTDP-D-glucose 4,6-dehydratase-like isoform X1 [Anneissia japonica]XP_033099690.1 dTDP-D-glucose 4,6-dehydratase-like isoform X2 [Anneissia japonica]